MADAQRELVPIVREELMDFWANAAYMRRTHSPIRTLEKCIVLGDRQSADNRARSIGKGLFLDRPANRRFAICWSGNQGKAGVVRNRRGAFDRHLKGKFCIIFMR